MDNGLRSSINEGSEVRSEDGAETGASEGVEDTAIGPVREDLEETL